ncbi:MAG: acyl carrier protein [Bauldia sp.]|nr:acyl carrier protein [Bauldia sp.]
MTSIDQRVTNFIRENFLFSDQATPLSPTDSLMEAGLIDSTGVLELVAFLEQEFGIVMADAEIVPANLDTIAGIAAYVAGKQSAAKAA